MISIIFDANIFKVLTLFALSPGSKLKRNEIKNKIKLNNVPIDASLLKLVGENLLKKEKTLYSINFENLNIKSVLELCLRQYKNLKEIPLDVYFLLTDFLSNKFLLKEDIYLFGSYSKLVYNEDSDIDIAIVSDNFKKEKINKLIKRLGKKYNKTIEIHIFDKSFYKNKRDPLVQDIIKNGVKLS